MELQFALLIVGIALVALVVIVSVFPAAGVKLRSVLNTLSKKGKPSVPSRASVSRQERAAPRLEGDNEAMLGEAELLDDEATLYDAPLVNDKHTGESRVDDVQNEVTEPASQQPTQEVPPLSEPPVLKERSYNVDKSEPEPFKTPQPPMEDQLDPLFTANNETDDEIATDSEDTSAQSLSETEPTDSASESLDLQVTPTEIYTSLKQIDYWVKLVCNSEYSKSLIMRQFGSAWNEMALNAQIHGLNIQDSRWHDFNSLPSGAVFKEFVISFQLLNNGQPHSANTLRRFTDEVDQVAKNLGASAQYLSSVSEAAVQSANLASLYANCQGHIEVLINSPAEQPFYGKVIETSAKLQGLDFEAGQYVRKKQVATGQISLYRLASADGVDFYEEMSSDSTLKSVKFSMQPSTSEHPGRVVKEMLDSAKAYASRVKGELQVFEDVEYHQDQLRQVRDYVSKIEGKMEEVGIPAGSAEAVRLFS